MKTLLIHNLKTGDVNELIDCDFDKYDQVIIKYNGNRFIIDDGIDGTINVNNINLDIKKTLTITIPGED